MLGDIQWLSDVNDRCDDIPYDADGNASTVSRPRAQAHGLSMIAESNSDGSAALAFSKAHNEDDLGSKSSIPSRPQLPTAPREGPRRPVCHRGRPNTDKHNAKSDVMKESPAGHGVSMEL